MKKICVPAFLYVMLLTNCTYHVMRQDNETIEDYYAKVNELSDEEDTILKTSSGDEYSCSSIRVKPDSTLFFSTQNERVLSIPTYQVETITFSDYSRFALKYAGIGAATGLGVGLLGSELFTGFAEVKEGEAIWFIPISVAAGALTGFAVPLIGGAEVIIELK